MSVSPEYSEFVCELFQCVGAVSVRKMFGGGGIYTSGVMFGLIANETVYLKTGEANVQDFEAEGSGPFIFEMKNGRSGTMSYYELPERLYDDPDDLKEWAMKALSIALESAKKKKPKKKAKSKTK